jgi:hypothetical protein
MTIKGTPRTATGRSKLCGNIDCNTTPKYLGVPNEALEKFKQEFEVNKRKRLREELKNIDLI